MKKATLFVILICVFCLTGYAESRASIGTLDDIFGFITVYCDHWNNSFGEAFGTDMSFDFDNFSVLQNPGMDSFLNGDSVFLYDIDGIVAEVDITSYDVISIYVPMITEKYDTYQVLSRTGAIMSYFAYDAPSSESELRNRYIETMQIMTKELEDFQKLLSINTTTMPIVVTSDTKSYLFYLVKTSDGIYFSTKGTI